MRKSFTWFLSLMVLLTAFATHGYAQEEQETVELYAEDASFCYNEDNDYTVTISVRDFIKLTEVEASLEFNEEIFEFTGFSGAHTLLTGINAAENTAGVIDITWTGDPATIGDNVTGGTGILVLHFSVIGYPGNVAPSFSTDLDWGTTNFWYTLSDGVTQDPVNTVNSFDGALAVNVEMTGIETEVTTETCAGGDVTLTVTAPEAAFYLFNEDPDTAEWADAWTTSPEYDVVAGEVVTVRVKDANGCLSLKQTVLVPETIDSVAFTVETQDPACPGGRGSVVFHATGGIAPYTYYISENADGSDAVTRTNFQFSYAPGTYYVAVQDANGCANLADVEYWQEITINPNEDVMTVTPVVTPVACFGGADGIIDVTVVNVTEVSLDGANWFDVVEGAYTFEDLSAGTYTVQGRNENGCVVTSEEIEVTEPESPITFNIVITDTSCGGDTDGAIEVVDVEGGTAPYEYSLDGETWVATALFEGLEPTYYSMWVRDAAGCEVAYENPNLTGNVIAVQSPDDIQFDVVVTGPACFGEDAVVTITNVTGGLGTYEYSLDGGSTWVDTTSVAWPSPYADLTVMVQNVVEGEVDACAVSQTVTAEDIEGPDAALTATTSEVFAPTCIDGNDGNIYLTISGGTKPYSYSVNGSSWKENTDGLAILRVGVGTHEILVKDANDCEIEVAPVTVTLEQNLITAVSDANIGCFGDKTGTISVTFQDWAEGLDGDQPVRDVQFYVENEAGVVSSFGPSNIATSPTTFNAGTYIVWVVDQYTCESNPDTVVITENPELLIDVVYTTAASCYNTFEGTITVHATGGNPVADGMLEYAVVNNEGALGNIEDDKWLPFETYNDVDYDPALSTVSFNVDGGTYWIAVRDSCDEKWYGPIEVEGYEQLLVDEDEITWTDPLCFEAENGTITVPMDAVTGGAGSYLFTLLVWEGEGEGGEWVEMEDYTDQATGDFTGLAAGVYAVMVEDSEGCPSYTTEEPIVLEDPEVLAFTTTFMHMSCADANDGTITVNVTGGTPGYSYAINNTNVWIPFGSNTTTSKTYIATEPGTFVVYVKDANECMAEPDTITILEPEVLDAEITITDAECAGDATGAIEVEGLGGWDGMTVFEFKVNDGAWTSAISFTELPVGDHVLHIRDVNAYAAPYQALDCEYSVPFTIDSPDPITYDVVIENISCKDGADGTFTVTILSGGTPFVDTEGDDDGYLVTLTGNDYNEGPFYTGADLSYTFEGLAHSHYTVYIEDANGCTLAPTANDSEGPYTTIESWEVQEPATYLTLDPEWVSDVTCYGDEDGQFVLNATGGTAPYKYWAGLSVEPDGHILVPEAPAEDSDEWQESNEFNVGAGTWVTWVMDANGCIVGGEYENEVPVNKWRVKIAQPDSIVWDFHRVIVGEVEVVHYVEPTCFGAADGQIHLVDIGGGSGTYNAHVWGTTAAGEAFDSTYVDIEANTSLLYVLGGVPASDSTGFEVTVMDDKGCTSAVDTIFIDQPEELTVNLEIVDGTTCFGAVDGVIEAVAAGGTGEYEYQLWKNGAIHTPWQNLGSSFLVEVGNTFTVEVRDANGCTTSDEIYLETPLEIDFTVADLSCSGDEYANVRISATGTPGRTFKVYYKEYEEEDEYTLYNGEFSESIDIIDVFLFDNENLQDRHYAVYLVDSEGCVSAIDTFTFDAIQSEVVADFTLDETTECTATYTVTVSGGVGPYTIMVDDSVMTEMTFTLARGLYTIKAMDSHMCTVEQAVEVVGEYVTRDTIVETFFGEEVQFVDEEAGVDSMLVAGTYEFVYMYGECERTLNVEVVEVARPLTIAEVQGEGAESEWVGEIVSVTGTVTGVSAGEGFFMQDANAAWSGIWVEWADASDLEIGDGVEVVGVVAEVATVTTLSATEVTMVDAPLVVEAIVADNPTAVENEMWESVLVTVEGGRATAADEGNGEWTVYYEPTDDVIVNDWLYAFTPVDSTFYHVTGIVNARLEAFKLEPRMESDIVDLGATPAPIISGVEFKVYPNPFNNYINIDNHAKLTRVVVSNIAGQRVLDIEYPTREIRTENLVSGVYVVSMFTENGLAKTERIVKR